MSRPTRTLSERWLRATDGFFDELGMRPFGILIFAASTLILLQLVGMASGPVRADAVASADWIDHPAKATSFVIEVLVRPGDAVTAGTLLVRLSPHFIDQRIARIDSQIEETRNEARLAQAQIQVAEQGWVSSSARVRPGRPSLRGPTAALFEKQIEVLETRKKALLDDRELLSITASTEGLVAQVARLGAAAPEAESVASITPKFASEIVAFVPADTAPAAIAQGAEARLVDPQSTACSAAGKVLRRGAAVVQAPSQLAGPLPIARHGLPVHISVPVGCQLGVGQVVAVDFEAEARP
ncbi:MAG: hypothetical protein CL910_18070 [Deltaproteobacteria bacterium]|nr:hypothetical protein [Deltaproteobacteria bacterium]